MLIEMRYLVVTTLLLSGCIPAADSPSESETQSTIVTNNRLAANRLAANRLAANRLAANRLAANRLAANRLAANLLGAEDLLATPEGREVLGFIVSCAVPADETLVADFMGTTYEFPGEIGLAPTWLHHPLDRVGMGWVSACLFARVNANDVSIPVSLRGPNQNLTADASERAGWPLEEGAFYGNLFTGENHDIIWIACRGRAQAAGETGGLIDRDCAEPDPAHPGLTLCGFTFAGNCGDFTNDHHVDDHACERFSTNGTYYNRCHNEAAIPDDDDDHDHHHHHHNCHGHNHDDDDDDHVFRQVITTYVTE
jgi:hypothetical protein